MLAYFSRSAVLECGGRQGSRPLFFLALYRLQNAKHFICWIISSYFSRLPPLRTRTSRSEGDYNLEQNPPIHPLNRGWSRAKAKTRHFPLLDLGVEGEECNFPIHYVQDCRLVKDDTKSLWFSYVKGCYYTHKHNTSPILLFFFADLHTMMYKDWLLSQKQQMLDRMEHLSWPWFFAAKDLTLKKETKNILSSSPNE